MGSSLPELLSMLHSNRAQAHLLLENYRNALEDSQEAMKLNSANLKVRLCVRFAMHEIPHANTNVQRYQTRDPPQGYYRGARAALKLGECELAAQICSNGLTIDGSATELQQLQSQAESQLQAAAAAKQREAARAMAERAPAKKLASELLRRQYQVGRPQMSVGAQSSDKAHVAL